MLKNRNVKRTIIIICFMALFLLGIYLFIGRPLISFVGDVDAFKAYVDSMGIRGILIFGVFVFIQTISTCIPGLPFYLAAGFAMGGFKGAVLCDIFATFANTVAFLIGKRYGRKFLLFIFPEDKLTYVESLFLSKNPVMVHVLFMLLPLPKDTYAWLGYYSKETLPEWIIITFIARFAHIFIYTMGAEKLLDNQYAFIIAGIIIFAAVYIGLAIILKMKKSKGDSNIAL